MDWSTKFDIKTHTSYYANATIPHKVTFIDIESPKWIKVNDYNKLKLTKIMVRVIEHIDNETNPKETEILEKYNVMETYGKALNIIEQILKQRKLGSSNITLWSTLDIVRLGGMERLYHSLNVIKDDKNIISITTQNVDNDGDKFPETEIPFNLMIGRTFNFLPPDSKNVVADMITTLVKNFPENPYYQAVIRTIPHGYTKAITHFITTIVPLLVTEYSSPSGKLTYKNRQIDTLISIKRNELIKNRDWAVFIYNMEGIAKIPLIINGKIKLVPRPLGSEDSKKFSLNIIPLKEMYTDFIENLKVVNTEINRRW